MTLFLRETDDLTGHQVYYRAYIWKWGINFVTITKEQFDNWGTDETT